MSKQTCPICGGHHFEDFNNRHRVRCESCGSLERGRYQWLVLRKCVSLKPGSIIGHFAPEAFFMDYFSSRKDLVYRAYDKFPRYYRHDKVEVAELDLCTGLASLPAASFDLIMHSHVLEHLPCAPEPVLESMKGLLRPGGVLFFSVPIEGEFSVEGIDPAKTPEEREMRLAQGEHMRIFGRKDFPAMLRRVLGSDCLIRQRDHFTEQELAEANIPLATSGEPTAKSVFLYRK